MAENSMIYPQKRRMVELDAEKVLSIPRKIRSREVMKRGFMNGFLFQNISNVFHAPMEVIEMIQNFTAVQEPQNGVEITRDTEEKLSLDKNRLERKWKNDSDRLLNKGYGKYAITEIAPTEII